MDTFYGPLNVPILERGLTVIVSLASFSPNCTSSKIPKEILKVYARFCRAHAFVFSALYSDRTKKDVRNCVHLVSSYPLMKGIRPDMIPSSYETGSDETKKNHKCKAKLFDLLCDSLLVRYCIGVVFCFVLFFSFMFFLAAVVNLIALKEPSKALITRTRPFQKENWNDLFCLIRYQKSILIS